MSQKLYHWAMRIRSYVFTMAGLMLVGSLAVSARQAAPPQPRPGGWTLPPNADEEKNPFAGDEKALAAGKVLYEKTCKKCHGPGGKGDGPDADPDSMQDMDLTNPKRAARNVDGIVFYKIWNGRAKPKMPAQKDELTKDQVWQIVSFAQTLRQKS
jgi:mono/diheme cytochrome c family protein